jgi:hypothetical protein
MKMAKTMMFEKCVALEVVSRLTDAAGAPLKNKKGETVTYNTLICYEFGSKYPELVKIAVDSSKLSEVHALVGKRCNILADVSLFNNQMSLYFNNGHLDKAA